MSNQRPLFLPYIDSTILSTFRTCPKKMFYQYLEHWKPVRKSIHLVAGSAFASGLEAARKAYYIQKQSTPDSQAAGTLALIQSYGDFVPGPKGTKTLERMLGALEFYYERYPFEDDIVSPIQLEDGSSAIEFNFSIPLEINHPQTGDPILYTGRLDMLAEFAGGIWVHDDKTTSSLGESWNKQWEMNSQFTGYGWAAKQHGIEVQGANIRGVSILKTKYDTQEVRTFRSPYEFERFEEQLYRDVRNMLKMWEEGYWDFNLANGCNDYGGCTFTNVCKSDKPEVWLPIQFNQKVWNPLAHKEIEVEEHEAKYGYVRETPRVIGNPNDPEEGIEINEFM